MDSCLTPFFSCSIMAWNWSSNWHWWLLCTAACPASQDMGCQLTAWKFCCTTFFHILSNLGKALIKKPIFMQVGLFFTLNLSSCTTLRFWRTPSRTSRALSPLMTFASSTCVNPLNRPTACTPSSTSASSSAGLWTFCPLRAPVPSASFLVSSTPPSSSRCSSSWFTRWDQNA